MRILIVDDDFFVRTSLKTIIEAANAAQANMPPGTQEAFEVVALGEDGHQAQALYQEHQPDVLLMDIRMPGCDGLAAAERLLTTYPDAKILFLTTFSDDDYIVKALRLGAKGYILKQHFEGIIPSLKAVYSGQRVFGDEIATKLPSLLVAKAHGSLPVPSPLADLSLTGREEEVLCQVANGLSNKEIAESLFLSEGTVRNYISTLLEKLELRDRTQLAIFYYKRGSQT